MRHEPHRGRGFPSVESEAGPRAAIKLVYGISCARVSAEKLYASGVLGIRMYRKQDSTKHRQKSCFQPWLLLLFCVIPGRSCDGCPLWLCTSHRRGLLRSEAANPSNGCL